MRESRTKNIIKNFFPGPITIILKKKDCVPDSVSAGLDTVGVRMPANKIAHDLIELAGTPIAAPSANISGKPSGTSVEDIRAELEGKVSAIVDGGETTIVFDTSEGVKNEYSLDGGKTWNPYTEAVLFTSNGTIIARVNDGTNYVTGSSQKVSQIDNEIPTVSVSGISTEYVASDDVTLTLEDSGSGVSYWCVTTENDSSNCSWNSIENSTSTTATYTATSNRTY